MKRYLILCLFSLSLVGILSTSCKSKKSGGDAYTIKMRLNPGDKFGQDLDMNMKMGFSAAGQQMDMNMGINGITAFEVVNDSGGMKQLLMTYKKMDISSEMKTAEGTKQIGNKDIGSRLVGKAIKLSMNDKNEITNVEGFESILDSTNAEANAQMRQLFSKDQMNSLFGMAFQMYPDGPVHVGDSWEKERDISMAGIKMKMKANYELKSVVNGVAHITVDGKIKGQGSMGQNGVNVSMDMDGSQKGSYDIGLANGYIKDSQVSMDVKANMEAAGQKIPMTMTGYYIIKEPRDSTQH
jgi:uncharacterized protein DUF6263